MANEFIARKGLIALESSQITGSLFVSGTSFFTGSVDISGGIENTHFIDFTTNITSSYQEGRINWIDDTKTLAIDTELNNFSIEVGHQNVIRVRNETGTTISRGRVVYLSGSSGNRPLIYTSSYEIDPTSAGTVGLVAADISTSNNGYVISNGLIRDINTTAFTAGSTLYLSSSGQLTTTPPISPLHEVRLGKVVTSAVSGIIHIDVMNGYEIGELHDVIDNTTSTTYGSLLVKSGSVWKDGYQLTGSYGLTGSLNATSFTGSLFGTSSWALNVVGGGGSTFPYTGSAIISGSLTVTGSTAITGGFDALGTRGSRIQLGTYNVGYDVGAIDTLYITGAGLIISGNMPDQNHHNFLKIGNVEMIDVNTLATTDEFLIHNVNTLRITSGADGGNITTSNQLLKIGGGQFYVYRAGSGDSGGVIQSNGNTTKITDTVLDLFGVSGSYFYIPSANEITTLNGTDYLMGFASDPSTPGLSLTNKIKADKFIWATGSNQIISGGLTVTGSLRASSMTSSLLGTASYAITASYALSSEGGGGVTINNNVSGYVVTATGTANTLNGESGLTFDGTTLTVANNAVITAIDVRNDPSTTIGQYAPGAHMGRDWPAAGGPALTAGNIVYFSGSSQWTDAQANATGSSTRVLGVVTDNADPNEIVLQGTVTINTDLATYQVGQPVYLSPISGGRVTNVPPSSSGHVARYVGWVVDTSRDQIYFNPDFTYIQL